MTGDEPDLRSSTECPICGEETHPYGRYHACPEHGAVLKTVKKIAGYRPLTPDSEENDDDD